MPRAKRPTPNPAKPEPDATSRCQPPPFPREEYAAALAKERQMRDLAFLEVTHEICGVKILPLTLRAFVDLCYSRSPFLVGGERKVEHVAQMLWRLSPGYCADRRKRTAFIRVIALSVPFQKSRDEIEEFLDLMFFDAPPSSGAAKPPAVSIAATIIDRFALRYGWSRDEILDTPMPQLFQLTKAISMKSNPEYCPINRLSDKVRSKYAEMLAEWDRVKEQGSHAVEKKTKSRGRGQGFTR